MRIAIVIAGTVLLGILIGVAVTRGRPLETLAPPVAPSQEVLPDPVRPPTRVTFHADKMPVHEALKSLRVLSRLPLEVSDLAYGDVTVKIDDAGPWAALDRLCAAHGDIQWHIRTDKVIIEPGTYHARPMAATDHFVFQLEEYGDQSQARNRPGKPEGVTWFTGLLKWTDADRPTHHVLKVDRFVDDHGTELHLHPTKWANVRRAIPRNGMHCGNYKPPPQVFFRLDYFAAGRPHPDARTIKELKGSVRLSWPLKWEVLQVLDKPRKDPWPGTEYGDATVHFNDVNLIGESPHVDGVFRWKANTPTDTNRTLRIDAIDEKGRRLVGFGAFHDVNQSHQGDLASFWFGWKLIDNTPIKSLRVVKAVDVKEVLVPFDFSGISLK